MKNLIGLMGMLLLGAASLPASAALKVLATTPDWGALTQELGGNQVNVYVATTALQDVHRVEAKPSLVARARSADLVVATGAELGGQRAPVGGGGQHLERGVGRQAPGEA
jgi:zinc/manganese transport system substrate-binding protein